jgi:hypothetical protein
MVARESDLEERLAQLMDQVPKRGIERHPLVLKSVSELSGELLSPELASLATRADLQTIIAFPPQIHRGWHYVPQQALLFSPSNAVHVQASIWPDQEPRITHVEGSDLMYMQVTLLLLYGFLEIVAQGPTEPTRLGVEFNTVAWYQLSSPLRQLLRASQSTVGVPSGETSYASSTRQAFENLPLKFSNGVKIYGLLPGEELEDLVFQPGTWERRLLLFRRPVSANTLLSLTSNYVTVIQEDLHVSQGWIISYIPRSNIVGLQGQPRGLWNEVTFQLKRGGQTAEYKLLLEGAAVQAWRERWIQHGGQWQDVPAQEVW